LPEWWAGNVADAASRWAVPVFVMISGALLLTDRRPYTPAEFYTRRAARLLAPLLFWTLVYLAFRHFHDHTGGSKLLADTIYGHPYWHLWFLYMLIVLYAVAPMLKAFVTNSSRATITTTAILIFVIASLDRPTMSITYKGNTPDHTFLVLWLPFTAYFLTGYILTKWPRRITIAQAVACTVICSGFLAIIRTYLRLRVGWKDFNFIFDPFNPLVVAVSVAIFGCFSSLPLSCSPETLRRIHSLAGLTLGIYLVHPLWLAALQYVGIDGFSHRTFVGIPFTTATAFLLSAITTAAIHATPILRRVV
jgi:surface polysaccharide O-acyltransferase-like enzyme